MSRLFILGTPIGNLADLSERGRRVLEAVDLVVAEDTRVTGRLLAAQGLKKRLLSYRAPVEERTLARVLAGLEEGDAALVTDAGTPAVSDPGAKLVAAAWEAGHTVSPVPGPSAVTAAISASGFAGPGFTFVGFLPRKPGEIRRLLQSLAPQSRPSVAFESPHRIRRTLGLIAEVLPDRPVLLARELTKIHEELLRGPAGEVLEALGERARGEFTLVIAGA
ncbi:MAG TPA: 16S rRNA (cytidine(1402)-2'-O)-methyltransferase [Candidatus Nitrosotalea sp.]|nr:16S rRNA (cytidine(1402)-2'-O)-methyltransferase [Candidatus Nitrosotalea sp.]